MDEKPSSNRDKDVSDNDDRPPLSGDNRIQYDFICFGFRQRSVESRLLDVVYPKYKRSHRMFDNRLVGLASTEV